MIQSRSKKINNWLKENFFVKFFSAANPHQLALLTAISIIVVIAGYTWFISYGFWTTWRNTTNYYDQLATAFTHGSLALEKPVDPALLLLANPYDPKERKGMAYPLDFSLYKGKYYLYFGPAPALLLAIFKLFGVGRVGDHLLTFIFISGICLFQSLLLIEIRKQFFSLIPIWIVPICIIFSGLIYPLPWILTEARVYEVASTSGQFFLITGLYFNFLALKKDSKLPGRFLISGILWALALGSRPSQALSVGFLSIIIMLLIIIAYLKTNLASKAICSIASLGLPLVIGAAAIGWYNWARFSSFFETGYLYQLTSSYHQEYAGQIFSPLYILPNLYDYFAAPPKILNVFPFFKPIRGKGDLLFPFLDLPKIYYTRATTGIIYSIPFIFFAVISALSILFPKTILKNQATPNTDSPLFKWLLLALWGTFLCGLAPFASYYWVEGRFFMDFSPPLVLLSIIGFWQGYGLLLRWPITRKIYAVGGSGLMIISVGICSLLVFAMRSEIYQGWHPELWNQLSNLLSIFSK